MAESSAQSLFPDLADDPTAAAVHSTGILPCQAIAEAIARGEIQADPPVAEAQIQPASLDLRLGPVAYRVRASFLPGRQARVQQKIDQLAMHRFDLTGGAVLERDCVYIVPLAESLNLRAELWALANPKSTTGRLDVFARLITDYGTEFDRVRQGYRGPLYAEISPRTFSIRVEAGSRLVQLRLKRGMPPSTDKGLRELHRQVGLIDQEPEEDPIRKGLLAIRVDTEGDPETGLIGYKARRHAGLIDVEKVDHYDPLDYWDPVTRRQGHGIILDPFEFYILASKESITVPPSYAAEMVAYDTTVGEFRVHYAGFFDPGFGHHGEGGDRGTRAVLEVRSHEVPFLVEDGQVVGRLFYERLTAVPEKLYGAGIGSSYQGQGLTLSKQFKRPA